MKRHQENADHYRALAALARGKGEASLLDNVGDAHARAAARWDTLAALEDMYLAHSQARLEQVAKQAEARLAAVG